MVKPATNIRKTAPISEIGIATTGINTERNDPQEEENNDDHDQQGLDERV